ncbi:MAG: TraB/GumN family protein [Treponema sp.]|jgi:pheromone shutdown-related protein TraB|nr:TraB/GumN family protein [Treponema sp.]
MNDTKMIVTLDSRDFILVGTAHVSLESINEVNRIIREEKPDLICVELDESRYASITQKDTWENLNMVKVFKEKKGFLLIANLVLAGFQRRMGAELGVKPGDEMKAALDTAQELDIPHALCDRDVQITLRRAWTGCGLWNKSKLLATLFASAFSTEKLSAEEIENLKNRSELDGMMNELASYLPDVKETLIDERDQYLAAKIWSSAQTGSSGSEDAVKETKRIVAVVGAGHMTGIKTHLEKISIGEKNADVSNLNVIPPKSILSSALPVLFPLAIVALIVAGFLRGGTEMSFSMLRTYILWNGSLAAFGAILGLAHPLGIITAFLAAPITTFTPFIGVGVLSGLIQVSLRKPRVIDAQNIIDDVGSLKGLYRNRITRALLVFFLTQLGGAVGTFVTIPALAVRI